MQLLVPPLGNLSTLNSLTFRTSFSAFHCLPAPSVSCAREAITKTIPRDWWKANQIDAKKLNVSAISLTPDWSVRKATPSDNTERTARSGAVVETIFLSRPWRAQCIQTCKLHLGLFQKLSWGGTFFFRPLHPQDTQGVGAPRPPGHVSALINPPHYGSNMPWPPGQVTPPSPTPRTHCQQNTLPPPPDKKVFAAPPPGIISGTALSDVVKVCGPCSWLVVKGQRAAPNTLSPPPPNP